MMKRLLGRISGLFAQHESAKEMSSDRMPVDYVSMAVEQVLRGSKLSADVRFDIAETIAVHYGESLTKVTKRLCVFMDGDFDWPWLDEWLEFSKATGEWPEGYGWDALALPSPDTSFEAFLSSLRKSDLMFLAKQHAIKGVSRLKVGELRRLLLQQLDESSAHISNSIATFAKATKQRHFRKFIEVKVSILAHSVTCRSYNLHRARQVSGIMSRWRIYADSVTSTSGPVEERLWHQWCFNKNDLNNVPPFYPGDHATVNTERLS